MERKKYVVRESIKSYKIEAFNSDVNVHSGDVDSPIIIYEGDFEVLEENDYVLVKENSKNIVNSYKGGQYNIFGNNVFISCGVTMINEESSSVEVIVPKNTVIKLKAKTVNGTLTVSDLELLELVAKSSNGSIKLKRINSVDSYVKTSNGSIKVEILESIINYNTKMKTCNGNCTKDSDETMTPEILQKKNMFEAETSNGNIKILFKGKTSLN
ncbi:MAG: DUF4097 family beta strand repeat protein [Bacilli bacterium]|nr:DUF4097 family beta strand repeat protein [Bacilli bacterium]